MIRLRFLNILLLSALPLAGGCATTASGPRYHTDPVCHSRVPDGGPTISCKYRGETFYFDSEKCLSRFEADPE